MNFILYKYHWKQTHHPPEHIISFIPNLQKSVMKSTRPPTGKKIFAVHPPQVNFWNRR